MKNILIGIVILGIIIPFYLLYKSKTKESSKELNVEKIEWLKRGYQQGYLDGVLEAHKIEKDSTSYKDSDIDNSFIKFVLKEAKL